MTAKLRARMVDAREFRRTVHRRHGDLERKGRRRKEEPQGRGGEEEEMSARSVDLPGGIGMESLRRHWTLG